MPRLTPVHWKKLQCVFEKLGFKKARTLGSHMSFVKPGVSRPIVIPKYPEIDVDIIRGLLRTANISRDEYFKLLKKC